MCTLSTNCKYDLIFSCSKLLIAKYVKAIFRKQSCTLKKKNIYKNDGVTTRHRIPGVKQNKKIFSIECISCSGEEDICLLN